MYKQTLYLSFIILFAVWSSKLQAQILYHETFETAGEGIKGPQPPVITPPSGAWQLSGDFSGLTATSDYFQTGTSFGEGRLEVQDTDQIICFLSDPIDISDFLSVTVSMDIFENGDLEVGDFVNVSFIVDGVEQPIANYMGLGSADHTLTGDLPDDNDFEAVTLTSELSGSSLVISICAMNNAGTEQFSIDNVVVEAGAPIPSNPTETITGFSLINANTNQAVAGYDPIPEGANIDLALVGTSMINFRANTNSSTIDHVKFTLSRAGQQLQQTEFYPPYALFGDVQGDYLAPGKAFWKMLFSTPSTPFTLTATPFDHPQGQGTAGMSKLLNFTLSFGSYSLREGILENQALHVYPNPGSGIFVISGDYEMQPGPLKLEVCNTLGQIVYQQEVAQTFSQKVDLTHMENGLYLVKVSNENIQDIKKILKK